MSKVTHKPLRVLYVTHASNLTGASRSLLDLLGALNRSEVEPTVLLREHGPIEAKLGELEVPYRIIPYVNALKSQSPLRPTWLKKALGAVNGRMVAHYMRGQSFDLVHSNSILVDVGMRAAAANKLPYVAHVRDFVEEDHGMVFLDKVRMKKCLSDASLVICISEAVRAKFSAWAIGGRLTVIPNGVDSGRYLLDHGPILAGNECRLLLAGRIAPGKGQLDAIKATRILVERGRGVRLVIVGGVGDETYERACRTTIEEEGLGGVVEMVGFTDDLATLKGQADISLMCSSSEALGRATIEGMLAGTLVIGAASGATVEIIRDGENGLLYANGDPASLADAVERALAAPEAMREVARRGQKFAREHYDVVAYAKRITQTYEAVVHD